MTMKPKLREIHIGRRKSSVKRRDVAAAVKAVIAARNADPGRSLDGQPDRKSADRSRK